LDRHHAIPGSDFCLRINKGFENIFAALFTNFGEWWADLTAFISDAVAGGALGGEMFVEDFLAKSGITPCE